MKRLRLLASIVTGLLVAVALGLVVYALIGNIQANRNQEGLARQVVQTQHELARTQNELEASGKASAETRITTVTQRCDFTRLVTNVLIRQDPQVAGPFEKSLAGCLVQLALVKKIAAAAPSTTTTPTK
jgi:hypothetical protein